VTAARTATETGRKVFLIATEESGDRLGANLMKVLRQRLGGAVQFEGVGGRAMAREGLTSLFPIEELSIIGLAAVVTELPKILRLIRHTAAAVTEGCTRKERIWGAVMFHLSTSGQFDSHLVVREACDTPATQTRYRPDLGGGCATAGEPDLAAAGSGELPPRTQ